PRPRPRSDRPRRHERRWPRARRAERPHGPISSVPVTRHATITGVGSSLPPRLVPNTWFEGRIDTTDEWIRSRTGIEARHFVDDGVVTSDLAVEAARIALDDAGIPAQQIHVVISASVT